MTHTLITGASEGLGRAFAAIAAAEGHRLVLSARNEDRLRSLQAELKGADVTVIPADLSRAGEADRLWDEASRGRDLRVLVNNAGLGRNGALADADGWEREAASVAVNVVAATVLMKRAAVDFRAKGGGRILNVASLAGYAPTPHMAVYGATKAYLLSLSEAAASELEGSGVTVTALCPGATATSFFAADGAEGRTALSRGRMDSPEEVARAGWWGMKEGARVVTPGPRARAAGAALRVLPRGLATAIMGRQLRRR